MSLTRWLSLFLLFFVFDGLTLCLVYPIWQELRYARYSAAHWVWAYGGAAAFVSGLSWGILRILSTAMSGKPAWWIVFAHLVLSFVLTAGIAFWLGTTLSDTLTRLPGFAQDIEAKFLSEWQFIRFSIVYLPLVAMITLVLDVLFKSLHIGSKT